MFKFPKKVASLDEVPQKFRSLYAKAQGSEEFELDTELATEMDTTGLNSALEKERKRARDFEKEIGGYKKLGALEELQQRLDAAGKGEGEKGKEWERLKADMLKKHGEELAAKDAEITKRQSAVETYLVDAQATAALAEHKGNARLLLPHVKARVRVVEEEGKYVTRVIGDDGEPVSDGKGGYRTIKDFVGELKKSADYAAAFEASGKSGSGTRPGTKGGMPGNESASPLQLITQGLDTQ